jgi:Tol biopolymer transport system component
VGWRISRREKAILLLALLLVLVGVIQAALAAKYLILDAGLSEVSIVSPPSGWIVETGQPLSVQVVVTGRGLVRSELLVDGQAIDAISSPRVGGASVWSVAYSWVASPAGQHRLSARAFDISGHVTESRFVVVAVGPGGTIAFSSRRAGSYEIYSMRTDGSELARLTSGEGEKRQPSCAKKGALLFALSSGGQASEVCLQEPQATYAQNLTSSLGGDYWPRWAPQERTIAFVSDRYGPSQLFLMDSEGGRQTQLTTEDFPLDHPSWSPDGSTLLVAGQREDNWDIFSVTARDGSMTRLTDDIGQDLQPAWSPRDGEIAFVSDREGSRQIYLMQPDGSDQRRITAFPRGAELPQWSPDGEWILCVAYTGQGSGLDGREIYLLTRDGSDPMRLTDNAFDDTEPVWCEGQGAP